jgi:putative inorganic carbon (HCO3(-)) transporter
MAVFRTSVRRVASWIDHWHWALLLIATPFLLFPSAARSPALLVVPGLWISAGLAQRNPLPRTPLNATLLLLFVMVLVSLWATYDLLFSLSKIAGMVLGIGVFFAVVRFTEKAREWWLGIVAYLGVGLGIAVLGLLSTNWLHKVGVFGPILALLPARIIGLPGAESGFSGNELAGALLWVIPLYLSLMMWLIQHFRAIQLAWGWACARALAVLLLFATFVVLSYFLLAQSRSGYLGFVAGVPGLVLVCLPSRWRRLGMLAAFLVFAGMVLLLLGNSSAFSTRGNIGMASDPALSLDTLEGRAEVWSRAIHAIQDFPLTGMGINTFRRVVHVLYPLFLTSSDFDISHAHNEYLQAALDLGIPGLIAFVALYLIAFWMLAQVWRLADGSSLVMLIRAIVLGFGAGLGAHLVYGMTEVVAFGAKPGFVLWMLLGLIVGLYQQTRSGHVSEWQTMLTHPCKGSVVILE